MTVSKHAENWLSWGKHCDPSVPLLWLMRLYYNIKGKIDSSYLLWNIINLLWIGSSMSPEKKLQKVLHRIANTGEIHVPAVTIEGGADLGTAGYMECRKPWCLGKEHWGIIVVPGKTTQISSKTHLVSSKKCLEERRHLLELESLPGQQMIIANLKNDDCPILTHRLVTFGLSHNCRFSLLISSK